MISILGKHISIIRPSLIKIPSRLKDAWRPKYNKGPKTRKFTKEELEGLKTHYEKEK